MWEVPTLESNHKPTAHRYTGWAIPAPFWHRKEIKLWETEDDPLQDPQMFSSQEGKWIIGCRKGTPSGPLLMERWKVRNGSTFQGPGNGLSPQEEVTVLSSEKIENTTPVMPKHCAMWKGRIITKAEAWGMLFLLLANIQSSTMQADSWGNDKMQPQPGESIHNWGGLTNPNKYIPLLREMVDKLCVKYLWGCVIIR
jgi:hypothetical protein